MSLVRLTKTISFDDINSLGWPEAYKQYVEALILNPCMDLDSINPRNTDNGMAIWILLLSFFESHAQFLKGESSNNQSSKFFKIGFEAFLDFLTIEDKFTANMKEKLDLDKL